MVKTEVCGYVVEHQDNVKQEKGTCMGRKTRVETEKLGLEEVKGDRAGKTDL